MTQLRWSPNGAWQVCCMSPLHVPSHASGLLFFSSLCTLPTARMRGNRFLLSELAPRLSPIFLWARRHCLLSASHECKPISSSAPPPGTSSAPTVLRVSPAPPTFEEAVYTVSRQCGCVVSTMCIGHSGHSSPVYWIFPSKHGVLSPNTTQTKPNTSTLCLLPATANLSLHLGKTSLTGLHPGLHFPDHCFLIPIQISFILPTPLLSSLLGAPTPQLSSLPGAPKAPMPDQPLPSHLAHRMEPMASPPWPVFFLCPSRLHSPDFPPTVPAAHFQAFYGHLLAPRRLIDGQFMVQPLNLFRVNTVPWVSQSGLVALAAQIPALCLQVSIL